MLNSTLLLKKPVIAIALVLAAPLALANQPATPAATPPTTPPTTPPATPPTPPPQATAPATPQATPPAAPQPSPPAATVAKANPNYRAGSVVTVYQLQDQGRRKGGFQQGQPIGSFVSEANPWNLGLHKKQADLAFYQGEPLGYEADAYFVAKEAGTYSFGAEVLLPPAEVFTDPDHERGDSRGWIECRYRLTVAGEVIIDMEVSTNARGTSEEERKCGLTGHGFGTAQLDAGLHRTRQWLACTGERRLRTPQKQYVYPVRCPNAGKRFTTDSFPADEAQVTVRVRHPQENTPVLVKTAELIHEKH